MDIEATDQYRRRQQEFVALARTGDRRAFDCLVTPLRGGLLGIAFLRTGDRLEAEDLVQEALARGWERIADLRDPSAFSSWIRTILARACGAWHRRSRAWPESLYDSTLREYPADTALQPLNVILRRQRDEELRAALRDISPENRDALLMAIWGDCTYLQIAEFAQVPVTTVEGRIYRAKSQLRKRLANSADVLGESRPQWRDQNPKEKSS